MSQDFEDRDPFIGRPKCWLVGVRLGAQPMLEVEEHLDELHGLATAAGGRVRGQTIQNRDKPDPGAYIGRGKAEEIGGEVKENEIDLVVFDDDLPPSQVKKLEELDGCAVIDRSGLILEIFHQRARTSRGAHPGGAGAARYLLPRLTNRWTTCRARSGGIGVRGGEGETQLEADRRMLRTRSASWRSDLERSSAPARCSAAAAGRARGGAGRLHQRRQVDAVQPPHRAGALVEDRLFATLDSKLRRGRLGAGTVALRRHRRLHPQAAPPPGGVVPQHHGPGARC